MLHTCVRFCGQRTQITMFLTQLAIELGLEGLRAVCPDTFSTASGQRRICAFHLMIQSFVISW